MSDSDRFSKPIFDLTDGVLSIINLLFGAVVALAFCVVGLLYYIFHTLANL